MNTQTCSPARCASCHYYEIEGRRGGSCHLLGVPVRGSWNACSMSYRTFTQPPEPPHYQPTLSPVGAGV
ncbi:MAG TPA: hypothetical protein IGS52_15610 [Oscillatoriaceae cyanobacterium M33_DOE_052]|uniref:Uncharacterized protein n=1 Tax=Planktothricoides sp. SpSt-374 TaxID=2282167 RepID=A0A7C3ZHQ4_9CYAN|nr:hypothetical protein [Oscillatoriaceae cyanobacterium M33_DOE_052]